MTTVFTIRHGSRPLEEFIALLKMAGVRCLVDVRAYPASRRHPQFALETLGHSLAAAGISYVWEGKMMGGRRRVWKNSPHAALRNDSFQAYADHMMTEGFQRALGALIECASRSGTAIMCAERLPWQCHRFLISDYIVARGANVVHLVGEKATLRHNINPVARLLENGMLLYNGRIQGEFDL